MVAELSREAHRRTGGGVKRVVLIGSESTGKTTLARRLAEHYGVEWVREFVREYAAAKSSPVDMVGSYGPKALGTLLLLVVGLGFFRTVKNGTSSEVSGDRLTAAVEAPAQASPASRPPSRHRAAWP